MTYNNACWISPDFEILDNGIESHITMVIKHPDWFGITIQEIESCYEKHNERMRKEGKAREEIILKLLDKNYIRVRLYPNKYWSVSAKEWNLHTKKALSIWANLAKDVKAVGKYMNVVISTHHLTIRDYTVEDLYLKKHLDNKNEVNSQ